MITRSQKESILKYLKHFPAVGIIGPRQVGKTTLVKSIIPDIRKEYLYLDLELHSDLQKLSDPEIFLEYHADKCVIIDEIQHKPELFGLLRALIDRDRQPGRYIILGSASPHLLRQSSESLAGRISYIQLSPLSLLEISGTFNLDEHWLYGGFPDALLPEDPEIRLKWLEDFVRSYTEKELPQFGMPASAIQIRRLWTMLAHVNGQILNLSLLSKSIGVSVPTIRTYIDFFEQAFLVYRLETFSVNIKKRVVKSPKIYISDTGILHFLLGIRDFNTLHAHPNLGLSWEAYVINQIRAELPAGLELYYYRTSNGSEVDLVFTKGLKIIVVAEIRYSSAPSLTRGNTEAIQTLAANNNYLITPHSDFYPINEKTAVCNVETFVGQVLKGL